MEAPMPQLHLRAEPGDYAPIVLLPGDPDRATAIAQRFDGGLANARQVNAHRHLYGYTGTFNGVPISVQTTSMGAPAAAIVVEELIRLGGRRLIRVGTTGGIGRGIRTGEIIIATAATGFDGTTATYLHGEPYAGAADYAITRALVEAADAAGAPRHVGPICTVDVFYNPDADYFSRWAARGILGFEMESSAIFYLAARAAAAGGDVRAGTILTVSDVLGHHVTSEDSYLPLDELARRTEATIGIALAAATSPAVTAGL
jgi:purine-nucleoside phosphorylase